MTAIVDVPGVVSKITSINLVWVIGGLAAAIILPAVARKVRGHRYPVINEAPIWDLFNFTSIIDFYRFGRARVGEGFAKFAGKPFILNTDVVPRIILSPDHIDEVNANKNLSFLEFVKREFITHLPCFRFFHPPGDLINDMVRTKLTQHLPKATTAISDEASLALSELWDANSSTTGEWQERTLKPDLLTLISRLSAIVFTGPELAHNPEWQRITIEVTVNGFIGIIECRAFPKPLQYLVSLIMPHAVRAGRNLERGKTLIREVLARREAERRTAAASSLPAPEYHDAIAWLDTMTATGKYPEADPATMQLSLAMAAIHTSTDLLTQTIFQMCVHTHVVPALREEVLRVIPSLGWTKQGLAELRLLDSFIKETQRLTGAQALVMHRVALADVELPGANVSIRKGEQLAISTHWMTSETFYSDAETFDAYRFFRRRDDPALAHKSHLVSTSTDHTGFSHGRHACPGRFFAASELKIALAHMLAAYDVELVEGPRMPVQLSFGVNKAANGAAKIRVRRRKDAVRL